MATVNENGKTYTIENGRVVAAVDAQVETQEEEVAKSLAIKDRVLHGKKLGNVVHIGKSIYGDALAVQFDDGSFGEFLEEQLERAETEKLAKVAGAPTADGFEAEYNEYTAMPEDTLEEIEDKMKVGRALNLRAKALATNSRNTLADSIMYDRIVTATALDSDDLKDAQQSARVVADYDYFEQLPRYEMPETVRGAWGMTRGGDASWLGAEELEVEPITEGELAKMATLAVAQLDKEQLEDKDFMRQVINYRNEFLPKDQAVRTRFAGLLNEARKAKLSSKAPVVEAEVMRDLDGNEVDLDSIPVESIFGE